MNERDHNQTEHSGASQQLRGTPNRLLWEELLEARRQLASYRDTVVAIQRSIVPQHLPGVPGLDLAIHFAEVDGVGGDFYDVRPVASGHWAIVIADVVGHGLAAAVILALVHALGNAIQEQDVPLAPGAALAMINKPLASRYLASTGQFVTAFVGLYDVETQMLTYSSAGHPPPRLVREAAVQWLDGASALPLGVDDSCEYGNETLQLLAGDRLVLFTDGVTESRNLAQDLFGDQRLDAVLRSPAGSAAEILDQVIAAVRTFRSGRPANDDETCLVARVTPGPAAIPGSRK